MLAPPLPPKVRRSGVLLVDIANLYFVLGLYTRHEGIHGALCEGLRSSAPKPAS